MNSVEKSLAKKIIYVTTDKDNKIHYFNTDINPINATIIIDKQTALNKNFLQDICSKFTYCDDIQIRMPENDLFLEHETKTLSENKEYINKIFNKQLSFCDGFSIEQAINASKNLNGIIEKINTARINGRELSPFEKFLWAYDYVTGYVYNESDNNKIESRDLISILSDGTKIVCVGYANLLSAICKGCHINCIPISISTTESNKSNHRACTIQLDDERYNIKGVFYSDPCFDSREKNESTGTFNYCLMSKKYLELQREHLKSTNKDYRAVDNSYIPPLILDSKYFLKGFFDKQEVKDSYLSSKIADNLSVLDDIFQSLLHDPLLGLESKSGICFYKIVNTLMRYLENNDKIMSMLTCDQLSKNECIKLRYSIFDELKDNNVVDFYQLENDLKNPEEHLMTLDALKTAYQNVLVASHTIDLDFTEDELARQLVHKIVSSQFDFALGGFFEDQENKNNIFYDEEIHEIVNKELDDNKRVSHSDTENL